MRDRFEAFAGYIVELNRCLQKIKDLEMQQFDLKANHTMCLYYLGKHNEGLTATQLTHLCKEDKAAISRCLNQLIANELVVTDQSEQKRSYRTKIYLTPKGKELVQKMNERIISALTYGGNGLSDEERNTFYDHLQLILDNLSNYLVEHNKK